MATWRIIESSSGKGHTDHDGQVMVVPKGDTPMNKAVRAHEYFHATTSPVKKPLLNRSEWEWLEEARIDWMVDNIGGEYRMGIRAFRQSDVHNWLLWGDKANLRVGVKTAIISRGHKMADYIKDPADRVFIAKILAKLSADPSPNDLEYMAKEVHDRFPYAYMLSGQAVV